MSLPNPVPKPWTLYILETRRGALYTGICTDLSRRFAEHASSGVRCAKSLRGKGPLTLKFAATVGDRSAALKLEYWLKQQSRLTKQQILQHQRTLPVPHQCVPAEQLITIQQQLQTASTLMR